MNPEMRRYFALALCAAFLSSSSLAQVGRRGGGQQVHMQNRSAGNYNRGGNANRNFNNNTNVNRNVNVNQNVNVNRNVNVNTNYHGGGCYNCGYYHDNDWNWGSFAAGAAAGAVTTAAVAAATRPATNTVVVTPSIGSVVSTLPGGCATVGSGGAVIYQCSNIYYRPYYQGSTLVYQVVTYP
jgi:hypothetical protein